MSWRGLLGLGVGSVLGGFLRYGISLAGFRWRGGAFPPHTLWANVLGCFLLGLFNAWAEGSGRLSPEVRLFFMTGFCGALTTFSSFILETSAMLRGGAAGRAVFYVLLSLGAGFGAFQAGALITRPK